MYATIATVIINTILDPVSSTVLAGAFAGGCLTIVAQVISLIWQLRIFSNEDELLHFHRVFSV